MPDDVPPHPPAPSPSGPGGDPPTVLGPSPVDLLVLWVGGPLVGAGACYGLLHLAGWMTSLSWVPFQGPARLVEELLGERGALGAAIALGIGVLAGLAFALYATGDIARVTVGRDTASITLKDEHVELARADVSDVFVDRKELVVLGRPSEGARAPELARTLTELETPRLAEAFHAHGWPWRDADPHAGAFRRWVPGDPALPPSADAVLRARAVLLEADKDTTAADRAELRAELARLGVVVRDAKDTGTVRQYWRPA